MLKSLLQGNRLFLVPIALALFFQVAIPGDRQFASAVIDLVMKSECLAPWQEKDLSDDSKKQISEKIYQKNAVFNLIVRNGAFQPTLADIETITKLNILCGTSNQPALSLLSTIPVKTFYGYFTTATMLASPPTSYEHVNRHRLATAFFVENSDVREKMGEGLSKIFEGNDALMYWHTLSHQAEPTSTFEKIGNAFAQNTRWLTTSPQLMLTNELLAYAGVMPTDIATPLDLMTNRFVLLCTKGADGLDVVQKARRVLRTVIAQHFGEFFAERYIAEDSLVEDSIVGALKNSLLDRISYVKPVMKLMISCSPQTIVQAYRACRNQKWGRSFSAVMAVLPAVLDLAVLSHKSISEYRFITSKVQTVRDQQKNLMGIACALEGLLEISNLIKQSPELVKNVPECHVIVNFFDKVAVDTTEIGYLLSLLKTSTFKGQPSFFSHHGRIKAAYRIVENNREALLKPFIALGKLESFWAAAKLVVQSSHEKPYSLVTLQKSPTPYLTVVNGHHPLVGKDKTVTHTFGIDGQPTKNIIITGPNGSGKSVVMNEIASLVVQAQALGIAPAEHVVLSPYDFIEAYLDVTQDLSRGLSTYMAQQKRFENILEKAEECAYTDKKILIIMDEPLAGTSSNIAGPRVYAGCIKLAKYPNITTVVASHFAESTKLAEETEGAFSSYYLDLIAENGGTTFKRTFSLKSGQHPWWNSDATLTNNYLTWLNAK